MASLASHQSSSVVLAKNNTGFARKKTRCRAVVVRASGNKEPEDSRLVDAPGPPSSDLNADAAKQASWSRKAKVALAGVAMTGASMVMPRPAQAVSEYVVNGGYATAGAAAASLILRAARGNSAGPAAAGTDVLLAPIPVPVVTVQKQAPPMRKLSKGQLAGMLLAEIPVWQRGVLLAVPAAALVGLVAATKKWVTIESLRIAQLEDHSSEKTELSAKLAALQAKLDAVTKSSSSFEKQLAAAMEASATSETKLAKAEADLKSVNASLVVSKKEVSDAGAALKLAKAEASSAAERLGEMEKSAREEMQKRADQAAAELEAQLAATADLRRELGLAQEETSEAKSAMKDAMKKADAAMKEADASRDAAAAESAKIRLALEQELHDVKTRLEAAGAAEKAATLALQEQEDWRKSREEWEEETKAAFLALEQELKETVAKLEAAEAAMKAMEEAEEASLKSNKKQIEDSKEALTALKIKLAEVTARAEAAEKAMKSNKDEIEGGREALTALKLELAEVTARAEAAEKAMKLNEDKIEGGKEDITLLELELAEVTAELAEVTARAEAAEKAMEEAAEAAEASLKSNKDEIEGGKEALTALKLELGEVTARAEAAEKAMKEAAEAAESSLKSNKDQIEGSKEALAALKLELAEVTARAEAAEKAMEEAAEAAKEARSKIEAEKNDREAAEMEREAAAKELELVRAELKAIQESMHSESAEAKSAEQAMSGAMADAQRLRDEVDLLRAEQSATAAALEDARTAMEASMMESAESVAEAAKIRDLKATHDAQMWDMECTIRQLEETMVKAHSMARQNAERMIRHNENMGRVINNQNRGDADIPVKFEIVVETEPGQRVAMVGTWNDWEVDDAFPMRWTEGNMWTVTTPIHADDTYEYKYVIIDDNDPDPMETAVWQYGNNRTLALRLSLHDEVVLVEVVDSWIPNPKAMPIRLHKLDGTVSEVGSTKLLRDTVRALRTEQALLDGSEYVRVLEEISTMTLGGGEPLPALTDGTAGVEPVDVAAIDASEKAAEAAAVAAAMEEHQAPLVELPDAAVPTPMTTTTTTTTTTTPPADLPDAAAPLEGDVTVMAKADGTTSVMAEAGGGAAPAESDKMADKMGAR